MGTLGALQGNVPGPALDLLEGRLTMAPPAGARIEARGHSVMAAPPNPREETRIVLDAPPERLVIMAGELYERGSAAFVKDVEGEVARRARPGGPRFRIVPLPPVAGLEVVGVAHGPFDLSRQAVPVMEVFARHPDESVLKVDLFVDPGAARDIVGCGMLSSVIATTLRPGPRRLDTDAGRRVLTWNGLDLAASTPAGWLPSRSLGPDFVVHTLCRVGTFGGPFARVGVYVGAHPSYHHQREPGARVDLVPGFLFGQPGEWHVTRQQPSGAPRPLVRRELIRPFPRETGRPLLVHAFTTTDDPSAEGELRGVVESLAPG